MSAVKATAPKGTVPSAPVPREIGHPVNVARGIAPKVTVRFVRVHRVTARSASGAREIGRAARDRHGRDHSVIRVNLVAGHKVGAIVVIFLRQKRDPAIALPKLWRVRGFAHDAMRKHGFLKAA